MIRFAAAMIFVSMVAGQEGQPNADEQAAMIAKMRAYAEKYDAGIPNFICTQVTTHYTGDPRKNRWKKGDTETAQLTFSDGKERRIPEFVNGKPVRSSRVYALNTKGEFVEKLVTVFRMSSDAHFEWKGWESENGVQLAVFNFFVDQQHSTKELISGETQAYVSYSGTVWSNPDTGEVVRIRDNSTDIPPAFQTLEIGTTIDYARVRVGGASYLLPVHSSTVQKTSGKNIRNDMDFRGYRKFESESTIHFGDAANP